MPDSLTAPLPPAALEAPIVAVASKGHGVIDQHFGHVSQFFIYRLGDTAELLETRPVAKYCNGEDTPEDKREATIRALAGVSAVFIAKIGDTPRERLSKLGIVSVDKYAHEQITPSLEAYRTELAQGGPAPEPFETAEPDFADFRMLHAMLRVTDMERSLAFYVGLLGMHIIEQREHKKNQFTQTYLGYGDASGMVLELVQNWAQEETYQLGSGFGHIAIAVNGIGKLCQRLAAAGATLPRPPRSQRHGENIVAFVEDPDGYRIELVQNPTP